LNLRNAIIFTNTEFHHITKAKTNLSFLKALFEKKKVRNKAQKPPWSGAPAFFERAVVIDGATGWCIRTA
jgi:hypothetical protein